MKNQPFKSACIRVLLSFILLGAYSHSSAQEKPDRFEHYIKKFEEEDMRVRRRPGYVLLVGSSTFTRWTDVGDYFPETMTLNRGFGGSTFPDIIYFADRMIFPYLPSKILIYAGDNDIAAGTSASETFRNAKKLRKMIAHKFPEIPVVLISVKPSLSRWKFKDSYEAFNRKLQKYAKRTHLTRFADTWTPMLNEQGEPRKDIFVEDGIHMNSKGYAIWKKILTPYIGSSGNLKAD